MGRFGPTSRKLCLWTWRSVFEILEKTPKISEKIPVQVLIESGRHRVVAGLAAVKEEGPGGGRRSGGADQLPAWAQKDIVVGFEEVFSLAELKVLEFEKAV